MRLAEVFYQYEHDASLRAAVLFGHGEHFSRGIDVDASQAALIAGQRTLVGTNVVDPLANAPPHRTKPLVVAVHGDTWNLGHELYLAGDIRVAAASTRFGQDENTHGRFPGRGCWRTRPSGGSRITPWRRGRRPRWEFAGSQAGRLAISCSCPQ